VITLLVILWLIWWLGGTWFSCWCWTRSLDLEFLTLMIALFLCSIGGPIIGLLWLDVVIWERRN
jgi:hypothetical protein